MFHQISAPALRQSFLAAIPAAPRRDLILTEKACAEPVRIRSWINDSAHDLTAALKEKITERLLQDDIPGASKLLHAALIADIDPRFRTPRVLQRKMCEAESIIFCVKLKFCPGKNPDHRPDPKADIKDHFESMFGRYRRTVEALASQAAPMHPDCMASICIPVAARDEGPYIYKTLKSFTGQSSGNNAFEILLLTNCPETMRSCPGVRHTHREIIRFKAEHPEMQVHLVNATVMGPTVRTIGFIRSLLNDTALLRHQARDSNNDHILIRCDADTRAVHPKFIENYLTLFAAHPRTDAFSGKLCWSPEKFHEDPLLWVNQTLYDVITEGRRIYNDRPGRGGPNWAIRGSMYAYLGGYNCRATLAEDVDLSLRLAELRDEWSPYTAIGYAGSPSRLYTSTRRAEAALDFMISSFNQWEDDSPARFREVDDVRKPREGAAPYSDERNSVENIEKLINRIIEDSRGIFRGFNAYSPELHKALGFCLGFDFEILNSKTIKILNADLFFERWRGLADRQMLRFARDNE